MDWKRISTDIHGTLNRLSRWKAKFMGVNSQDMAVATCNLVVIMFQIESNPFLLCIETLYVEADLLINDGCDSEHSE